MAFDWNPLSWPGQVADSFFKSAGGDLAAGLYTGSEGVLIDLWHSIAGPAYILFGAFIMILTLVFAFKNQLIDLAGTVAMLIPK